MSKITTFSHEETIQEREKEEKTRGRERILIPNSILFFLKIVDFPEVYIFISLTLL